MEFGKHLGKGLWGIADKALPVVYGVSYVVLVIRVLPEEEFGSFVLVQEIFLILSNLAAAFALHPLLKFAAEEKAGHRDIIGAALQLNLAFIVASSLLIVLVKAPIASLLNAPSLDGLMILVAAMLAANFVRNFTLVLLQTRFRVQQVFWIDAAHFIGAPMLILIFSWMHHFNSAYDLILINIISLSFSSVIGLWLCWPLLKFTIRPRREEMKKMWDYGKYTLITIVSNLLFVKSDSFIISAYGGPVQVALYGSVKIFVRIYDMVAQVVQMFVFPATSKLAAQNDYATLKKLVEKAIAFTTLAMLPTFFLFSLFAPQIVGFIYGNKYSDSAALLRVFSILSLLIPASSVATNVLMGLGRVRLIFVLSFVILIASIGFYLAFIPLWGAFGATLGYVLGSVMQLVLFTYYLKKFVPLSFGGTLRRTNDIKVFVLDRLISRKGGSNK